MKPTRAQLNLAAKLLTLSSATYFEQEQVSDIANRIRQRACKRAEEQLAHLGTCAGELRTAEECLEVAMRIKT